MVDDRIPLHFFACRRKEQVEAAKRQSSPLFGSFCVILVLIWCKRRTIGQGGVSRLARREAPTQGPPPGARGARRRSRLVPLVYTYMREVMSVTRAVLGKPTVGSGRGLRVATRGPGAPVFKLVWFFSGRPWVLAVGTELRCGPWRGASRVRGRVRGSQKMGLGRGHATVPWGFAVRPTVAAVDGKTRFGRFGGRRASLIFPGTCRERKMVGASHR